MGSTFSSFGQALKALGGPGEALGREGCRVSNLLPCVGWLSVLGHAGRSCFSGCRGWGGGSDWPRRPETWLLPSESFLSALSILHEGVD